MKTGLAGIQAFRIASKKMVFRSEQSVEPNKISPCPLDQGLESGGYEICIVPDQAHVGFCLGDTKTTEKKVTNSPLEIDVLAKLKKSYDQ